MTMELPHEYMPTSLRPPEPPKKPEVITYSIGYRRKDKSYAMSYGPVLNIMEMLETVPDVDLEGRKPYLIRVNLNGSFTVLYVWNKDKWTKL
jgi:hypothetical protein